MIEYEPIGIIETPFEDQRNMPIQPVGADGIKGKVILDTKYVSGLKDLDGFSHIMLIYHFHQSEKTMLLARPFLEEVERGIFATRGPSRPNKIGISVVSLTGIKDNELDVMNVDMLNRTPLLDIKPYVPAFNNASDISIGWLGKRIAEANKKRTDDRFL
ncbi:tRNA (N6-threonylcarbamoyladenosine(37)-N6)-methyltransferase TrmO [Planctomycetota bacterium]